MQTIAFETQPMNGWIQIPEVFKDWYDKTLKVILLREEVDSPPSKTSTVINMVKVFFWCQHLTLDP